MSKMKNQYDSVSLVSLFEGQTNNPIYQTIPYHSQSSLSLSIFLITLNLPYHAPSSSSLSIT